MSKLLTLVCLAFLLVIYGLLTSRSAASESLTFDEIVNMSEGRSNLFDRKFLIEPYNPPLIRELAAIPTVFSKNISQSSAVFRSRLVIMILGAALIISVFLFVTILAGEYAGFLASVLLLFDPTFLAHSHYITPDVGFTLFLFLSWFSFILYTRKQTLIRFLFVGLCAGLAAASKLPALIFLPLCMFLYGWMNPTGEKIWNPAKITGVFLIAALVVWSTFWFQSSQLLKTNNNSDRVSKQLISVANRYNIPFVSGIITSLYSTPIPMGEYLALIKNTVIRAGMSRSDFLFGSLSPANAFGSFAYYLLKTPIAFLLLFIFSLIQKLRIHKHVSDILILIPIATFSILALGGKFPPLVRYLLPILPFAAAFIGIEMSRIHNRIIQCASLGLLIIYVFCSISSYPHFLSYTNEFVPSEKAKILWFNDSNRDWGQGMIAFAAYLDNIEPSVIRFSYFGRDNGDLYGLSSSMPWGSYKRNEICAFHTIMHPGLPGRPITAISITNWHECGYKNNSEFKLSRVQNIIGGSILIFPGVTE